MRSIRKWAYEVFRNDRAFHFIGMVTPEDLKGECRILYCPLLVLVLLFSVICYACCFLDYFFFLVFSRFINLHIAFLCYLLFLFSFRFHMFFLIFSSLSFCSFFINFLFLLIYFLFSFPSLSFYLFINILQFISFKMPTFFFLIHFYVSFLSLVIPFYMYPLLNFNLISFLVLQALRAENTPFVS